MCSKQHAMKHDGGVHMTYHRYMRRSGNREVVHTSTTLLIVEVLGAESSTAPRHTQRRSRGSDGDGRMDKLIRSPRYLFAKVLPAIREIRVTNGGDGWLHDDFGRSCGLYDSVCTASSVEDFVRAGPGSTLCQDKERCSASKVLLPGSVAATSNKGLAWLEFEGKARTHNKNNINAIQEGVLAVWNCVFREEKRAHWFAAGGSSARIRPNVLGPGEWAEGRCGWPVGAHLLFKFRRGVERGRAC
jgi:hypothetical protein